MFMRITAAHLKYTNWGGTQFYNQICWLLNKIDQAPKFIIDFDPRNYLFSLNTYFYINPKNDVH